VANGLMCGALALGVPLATFAPFWTGTATLLPLLTAEARLGISPTWLLNIPFLARGITNLPIAAGMHGSYLASLSWGHLFQYVLDLAVLAVVISVTVAVARGASLRTVWRIVTAFIWTLPSVNSWYVTWLMPAVAFGDAWGTYAWWFGALAALHYAVDSGAVGGLSGAVAWAASIAIVFMGLPIVIALGARRRPGAQHEQAHAG
jgi:hypothetical protein